MPARASDAAPAGSCDGTRGGWPMPFQGAAAVVAAEDDPTSPEVVCLDGRLREALRLEGLSLVPARLVP